MANRFFFMDTLLFRRFEPPLDVSRGPAWQSRAKDALFILQEDEKFYNRFLQKSVVWEAFFCIF